MPHEGLHEQLSPLGVLGEKVGTPDDYDPSLLFPVPRARGRTPLGLEGGSLPFAGEDVWNCYELSWLQPSGVPKRKVLEVRVDCSTENLVESKSLKLYLNSLNFATFKSEDALLATIGADLQPVLRGPMPSLVLHAHTHAGSLSAAVGDLESYESIDDEPVGQVDHPLDAAEHEVSLTGPSVVLSELPVCTERLASHQLRTLCPVTRQPDWGSLYISYTGPRIDRARLLRFIVSLRREVGFHEAAVERVFQKLRADARPTELMVTGQFLRRGGVDINPTRTLRSQ
jgi:7-cyano-7-deazaguanine reductase